MLIVSHAPLVPMADSHLQMASVRNRTIVFTIPKEVKVTYADFAPALEPFKGKFVAFGTVGVSYIWHLTMRTVGDVDAVIDRGDFQIGEIWVRVTRFSDVCNVATLHWLPFWVPHSDVISSLCSILGSRLSCQYITIPQKGYDGCFSTQRRIESPVALDKLPHFVQIESEGQSYRTFLFVPGRPSVCFACGVEGHMKSSCRKEKSSLKGKSPVIPVVSKVDPKITSLETESLSSSLGGGSLAASFALMQQDGYGPTGSEVDSEIEKDQDSFVIQSFGPNDEVTYIKRGEEILVVNPPKLTVLNDDVYQRIHEQCLPDDCCMFSEWDDQLISALRFKSHLHQKHPNRLKLRRAQP